jgi:hypothetical protein
MTDLKTEKTSNTNRKITQTPIERYGKPSGPRKPLGKK